MKLALISPEATAFGQFGAFKEFWDSSESTKAYRDTWIGLSAGLLTIAGLTPPEHDIDLIDENFDAIDFDAGYDLVGISAMTQQATRAYELAEKFRARKIPVVMGGIHATTMPEEAKEHCDAIVIGEVENLWTQILNDVQNNALKPYYKPDTPVDLTDSPIPRYDLLKPGRYKTIWVQSTRGCPRDCEFCCVTRVYGTRYRKKSLERVVDEIKMIRKYHRNARIGFSDENLFLNKKNAKKFLETVTPLKIRFHAQSDISIVDKDELLPMLKKAGCINILIGFESLIAESLENIDSHGWKRRQLDSYAECVRKVQSHGIGVVGAFIVGLDGDDASVFKKTADFIIENHVHQSQITILTPLPNTRLRERLEKENRLLPTKWSDYTFCDVTFEHPTLSRKELEDGLLYVYKAINTEEVVGKKIDHFSKIYKNLVKKGKS